MNQIYIPKSHFQAATKAGRNWADVADVTTRTFLMKLEELTSLVLGKGKTKGMFGRVVAFAYSIELQQRGMCPLKEKII